MKQLLKRLFSQQLINNFYHLPKAILASFIYGFPTKKLKVIGITGTDGKTTTTNMIYQILKSAGKKVSMVSTINATIAGKSYDTGFHVTSPDPFLVQKFAKQAVRNGDEYLVLEVTSHALDQYRFWGIRFEVGVITNITHDHLDYHKTFDNYKKTKLKLLREVKYAIVNEQIVANRNKNISGINTKGKVITFGMDKGDFNQKEVKLKLKLIGDYNIENSLASLAVGFVLGIDKNIARKTLEDFMGISGRLEEVKNKKNIRIIVDFAHTPNALEQVLKALKKETPGRLIAVFGCAGKRDEEKREMMGEISKKYADLVVITSEDPRGDLKKINQQIKKGLIKAGGKEDVNFFIIDDRRKAIQFAVNNLSKRGDLIGIFGKGHETSLNLDGKREIPWSDKEVVKDVLNG